MLEEGGGHLLKKIWAPLNTADYAPYVAQIPDADAVCVGLAGTNPLKFIQQARAMGAKQAIVGGSTTGADDSRLPPLSPLESGATAACGRPY